MHRNSGAAERQGIGIVVPHRQLTIGECIALARYSEAVAEEGERTVDLERVLLFIDRIRVCTTCGWSENTHRMAAAGEPLTNVCAHYSPRDCSQ
jgi:hypothetical protein